MLSSLMLENYRCFEKHEFNFRELNVIVGANNAGKSTLVEALRLLSLVANRATGLKYKDPPAWTNLPRRMQGVMPAMGDMDLRGGSVFHRYGSPPASITAIFANDCQIGVYVGDNNAVFGVISGPDGEAVRTKQKLKKLVFLALQFCLKLDHYRKLKRNCLKST